MARPNTDSVVGDWQGLEVEALDAWNESPCADFTDRDELEPAWQAFCERAGADPSEWPELLRCIARELSEEVSE